MKLLLLGGTSEARALGQELAADSRFDAVLSLAGRTAHPAPQPLPTRSGGFGGAAGLAAYLKTHAIDVLVDATHPFAARISRNAALAAADAGAALLVLRRPPWLTQPGDRWLHVADLPAAAHALGQAPRRVFLTTGRLELAPFAAAPWHHYVLRAIEPPPPDVLPARTDIIIARGPFTVADEQALLRERRIDIVVTKNSGAAATQAKLAAARALRLPVIMVNRPAASDAPSVASVAAAMVWLAAHHAAAPRGA
jgi:precorrin-6A/cobalt-precorrin-6A reductase